MKKIYVLLLSLTITSLSFGQTILFQESFETGNSGTPSETCNDTGGDFFTRTDGTDISSSYSVSGQDGSFFFAAMDTDGAPCTLATQTLLFEDIDISTYSNLSLAILLAEDAPSDSNFDWDGGDLFYVEVDYDNSGSFTKIFQFATTETTGYNISTPSQDTDLNGIGDGQELTPIFTEFTTSLGTGNSIDIRLVFENLGSGDEDISVDNIRVIDGYSVSPTITIAAPSDESILAPGPPTTSLEWVTNDVEGGETVTVTVIEGMSSTDTPNATSPFSITVQEGGAYTVTTELKNSLGDVLDTDTTSFSVGVLQVVANVTALRADVVANGPDGFYEITEGSLLTHKDGYKGKKWFQDATPSGIYIYDAGDVIATTYNVGDMVSGLKGKAVIVNGVLQLHPIEDSGVIASSDNAVVAQTVTIAGFNAAPSDYESTFINFENVTFSAGDGAAVFATGENYVLAQGQAETVVRTEFYGADYIGENIPSTELANVSGIAGAYNGTAQLYVRNLADLTTTLAAGQFEVSKFNLYPNPTKSDFVNITSTGSGAMQAAIFDILGKQVINTTVSNKRINISTLNTGIYIVKLTQGAATTTKKLIIQ
mgnify:FL=1